jgi:hypothetical protein
VSLTQGNAAGFNVTDGRELFTPTPYLLAIDDNDDTNWGVLVVDQWTKETGDLATHVVYATKTQASTVWNISCNSALPAAFTDILEAAEDARDDAVAAQASVASQMSTLNAAILAIQSGPVASVAGRTGVITLALSDVVGLVDALASKATASSVTTSLAGKQDASAKLSSLVGLTWANNKIIYATSASTLGTLDISEFAKSILSAASASATLTALGVSTFIKGLLDDADAGTALSTLGFSDFIKTLINDADAAAARATLGVVKATSADVITGTDDAKFITAAALAGSYRTINNQTADYTLQLSDNRKIIRFNSSTNRVCFLPATFPEGWSCRVIQVGVGTVTFTPQTNATRNMPGGATRTASQYAQVELFVGANSDAAHAIWNGDGNSIT